ncbi:MAG: S8 family serine peptidase [Verrucomicrobiota bacterium]|jgi:hypothetical protein
MRPWWCAVVVLAALAAQGHKAQVNDPAVARAIVAEGGRLIADYGSYQLFETERTNGVQLRDDYNRVLLTAGSLDTSRPEMQRGRKPAGEFQGRRLHLVQFAGPVLPAWRQALIETGAQIVSYIPHNTYLVYGDAAALARVQSSAIPAIQWDGAYLDDYKTNAAARLGKADQFAIQLVADAAVNAATLQLLSPAARRHRVLNYVNVIARLQPADARRVAARPDVISIRPWNAPKKLCERQDQIAAGNLSGTGPSGAGYLAWLAGKGFTQEQFAASGFVVDVSDSGIDDGTTRPNHFGLYAAGNTNGASRVAYSRLEGTPNGGSTLKGCDGHGTINAHIVCGYDDLAGFPFSDSAGYHYGLGVCPFASVGASVIYDPDSYTYPTNSVLMSQASADGARISNNSWGYGGGTGDYGIDCQEFDALARDARPAPGKQEMVVVFGAGNGGPASQSVVQPGTAKNVITAGGADGAQFFGGADDCNVGDNEADNANDMIDSSSRGPCADGRHKPDLVAPSTHVSGGVVQADNPGADGTADPCYNADAICGGVGNIFYPSDQQFYTASSGTSHSTACVSGGCALLRQYFINQGLMPPSAAMTKAYLMNCARYLTGAYANDTLWSDTQGMGELDLGAAFDGAARVLRDELPSDTFTSSGQTRVFSGSVADTNLPFRVTVAWTDAPGSTTGAAYNNDLDLTVAIGGQTYLGNVFSNAWSATGGSADEADNVESVLLPAGATGDFTVTITAANINSIGVPNASNGLAQDFALVVDNALGAGPPVIIPSGSVLTMENCLPTNGAIDPGETVAVRFALQNIGTVNTTNLTATLLPGGGIVSPGPPANFGALVAGGAAVSEPIVFTAEGACGSNVTATLQLQDGGAGLGSAQFTLALGSFIVKTNYTQDFDAVTPPALPAGWSNAVEGGQVRWVTTNSAADTPSYSVFADAPTNAGVADLYSPAIAIVTATAQLVFANYYDLEYNPDAPSEALDGGVLEIQIGNGGYSDILAAGGTFVSNGYNKTIALASEDDNPLPGRQAWSGDSGGFVTTVVGLPGVALGQNVQFRWRCATDTGNAYGSVGWWIDSVAITDGGNYYCCDGPWAPEIGNAAAAGTNFMFSVQTASNETYVVEYKNALTNAVWTAVQSFSGDGAAQIITNGAASSQGYYRIRGSLGP